MPDVLQVRLRGGRKDVAGHQRSASRLASMKASKSKAVDGPLASPPALHDPRSISKEKLACCGHQLRPPLVADVRAARCAKSVSRWDHALVADHKVNVGIADAQQRATKITAMAPRQHSNPQVASDD